MISAFLIISITKGVDGTEGIKKVIIIFIVLAIITSILPVAVSKAAHKPIPLISKGVPAFASVGTASDANDENYGTSWKGNPPGWLAYDLSIVPESQRIKVQDG